MAGAILLLFVTACAGLVLWVAWLGFTGKLPRNGWAGIRTGYTMSSDERWVRTHRSAGPYMILFTVAALAAGLAFIPFAFADVVPDAVIFTIIGVQAVLLVIGALWGAVVGTRKAKAAEAAG